MPAHPPGAYRAARLLQADTQSKQQVGIPTDPDRIGLAQLPRKEGECSRHNRSVFCLVFRTTRSKSISGFPLSTPLAKNHSTSQPVGRTLRLQFARRVSFLTLACVPKGDRNAACHGFLRPGGHLLKVRIGATDIYLSEKEKRPTRTSYCTISYLSPSP